jgi:anti-anti-sigma regulatory factor
MLSPSWWLEMNMSLNKTVYGQLNLTGAFTICEVTELAQQLIPLADRGEPLHVNLAGVTEIDCAGLQLLFALYKANKKTNFIQPSPVVVRLLEQLDLKDLLIPHS